MEHFPLIWKVLYSIFLKTKANLKNIIEELSKAKQGLELNGHQAAAASAAFFYFTIFP